MKMEKEKNRNGFFEKIPINEEYSSSDMKAEKQKEKKEKIMKIM